MNFETGKCDKKSRHSVKCINKNSESTKNNEEYRKYVIQRMYYLESFEGLGQRLEENEVMGNVKCDESGSCRLYD